MTFIAHYDGAPVGSAVLIDCDLESRSHLEPWLASLVVARLFRRKGVGRAVVAAVETAAARRRNEKLFLYSSTPGYYRPFGWRFLEAFEKQDGRYEIMSKKL